MIALVIGVWVGMFGIGCVLLWKGCGEWFLDLFQ